MPGYATVPGVTEDRVSKMPWRKIGEAESPLGDGMPRAVAGGVSDVLLLRDSVLFMKVRANEWVEPLDPLRSPLTLSTFGLVLVALARRKKLKLGRRPKLSEGEAGFSGLLRIAVIAVVSIGGSACGSMRCVAVLVVAVVFELSSKSSSSVSG